MFSTSIELTEYERSSKVAALGRQVLEVMEEWVEKGHPFDYFLSSANMLDFASYILIFSLIGCWLDLITRTNSFAIDMEYKVYKDYKATGRLPQTTKDMGVLQDVLDEMFDISQARLNYGNVLVCTLMLVCLQMLKNLDFHPQMVCPTRPLITAPNSLVVTVCCRDSSPEL